MIPGQTYIPSGDQLLCCSYAGKRERVKRIKHRTAELERNKRARCPCGYVTYVYQIEVMELPSMWEMVLDFLNWGLMAELQLSLWSPGLGAEMFARHSFQHVTVRLLLGYRRLSRVKYRKWTVRWNRDGECLGECLSEWVTSAYVRGLWSVRIWKVRPSMKYQKCLIAK